MSSLQLHSIKCISFFGGVFFVCVISSVNNVELQLVKQVYIIDEWKMNIKDSCKLHSQGIFLLSILD